MIHLKTPEGDNPILEAIRAVTPYLDIENGPWVAGGVARLLSEGVTDIGNSDIDLFFPNDAMFNWATSDVLNHKHVRQNPLYNVLDSTKHPLTTKVKLQHHGSEFIFQFIKKRFYVDIDDLYSDFDFTTTMFATDGFEIVADDRAPVDSKARILNLNPENRPVKPKAARLAKYCAYGFTPGPGVLKHMLGVDLPIFAPTEALTVDEY